MRVAKWGNSLAIRIPAEVVERLGLKEGDELTLGVAEGEVRFERDLKRSEALDRLRKLGWTLPADYRFDREEAHEREGVPGHQRAGLRRRGRG